MLHEFLAANRDELIRRCRIKVARRFAPEAAPVELEHGIPRFLDQLIKTLQVEQTSEPLRSFKVSGPSGGGPAASEIAVTANVSRTIDAGLLVTRLHRLAESVDDRL